MVSSSSSSWRTLFLLLVLPITHAGIQPFDLVLQPTDAFVHYNDGYIRAPGVINLSGLTFTAISDVYDGMDDAILDGEEDMMTMTDDVYPTTISNETTSMLVQGDDDEPIGGFLDEQEGGEDAGGVLAEDPGHDRRRLDGGVETDATAIDIAVFRLPAKCVHTKNGCDWPGLGVGNRSDDGSLRWCCSSEALAQGMCQEEDFGRLMIDKHTFEGNHRFIVVPDEGPMSKQIKYGSMEELESGTYVVLYANCNERGREIYVKGESVWKSKHGFLPGELFGFMYFYIFTTCLYFGLLVWFGVSMYMNEEHRIEIEKWIFFAIVLGFMEMIFRTGDYFVWNIDGYRSYFVIWIGVLTGVFKQGISRCLIVMVSMGWGVVRDSLGSTMRTIVFLGTLYIVTSVVCEMMIVFAIEDTNTLSIDEEKELLGVAKYMTIAVAFCNIIFIMWILDALNNTMMYLETMKQSRKLERFLKLRCLFLLSILMAVFWAVFTLVDTVHDEGIVAEEHAWAVEAATEINYLFVLVGVAFLWKPNPSAKEYAFAMELPEDDDIELSDGGGVPTAAYSDEGAKAKTLYSDEDKFEIS